MDLDLDAIKAATPSGWVSKIYKEPVVVLSVAERDTLVAEVERLRGLANVFEINVLQP